MYFKSNQEWLRERAVGKIVDCYTPEKMDELMGCLEVLSKSGR